MRAAAHRPALGARRCGSVVLVVSVLMACNRPAPGARVANAAAIEEPSLAPQTAGLTTEARQQLTALRAVTAPYRDIDAAKAAGFMELTGCMSDPVKGGTGMLYGMTSRFDATPEPNAPEMLVYAPEANGKLRLVAAEFAVPMDAWTSPEPPMLFGQAFHQHKLFGLWVLHAWLWKTNPSGMFAEYNPTVLCEDA